MNRVYKVIWSKAKHCYVVTSEIAKSHTKGESTGRGLKKLAAALLVAAALMGPNFAWAADTVTVKDTTEAEQIVYTQKGADDQFATKTELAAKANADDVENTYAKTADVANTYVNKTKAEVTFLTVDGDVEAHSNLTVGNGNFKVDGSTGNVTTGYATIGDDLTVKGDTEMKGDLSVKGTLNAADGKFSVGNDGQLSVSNGSFKVDTDGGIYASNGSFKVDTNGGINIGHGTATIDNNGNITGKKLDVGNGDIKGGQITGTELNVSTGDIKGGQITGTGLDVGAGTINTTGTVKAGDVQTGTLKTGGNAEIGGTLKAGATTVASLDAGSGLIKTTGDISGTNITGDNVTVNKQLTTKDMEVKGEFKVSGEFKTDHITLGSKPDNYTEINTGNVTSEVNDAVSGVKYTAESIFNKDGSSITARTDEGIVDSTGKSIVGAKEISQYLGDNAKPDGSQKNVTRKMVRNNDGTFSMEDKAVDGENKYSTVSQNAGERKVTVIDGTNKASTNLSNNGFNTYASDGTNKTYTKQTAVDIKNTAKNGMISNTAKNLVNTATENMTNTVGGNLTTTVTGDSSLTAENITNEAKNRITNKAIDVETDATSSIVQKVTNDAGSNTSTQWSYQTKEEMSQTDGKTAFYLRGAAEEKSELTDGDVKTTIDTIAGQTNTHITDGTNTSNDLQKADQIASSVTDGTNTTVVNQDARSLASSITDGIGTKVNNSIHWVDGSAQRIEVDDTHFYAETRTAEKAEEALKSGNTVIDIVKDTNTATVSSAVTDGATITGISQNAKDISLSAAGGTIASGAKNISNTAAEKLSNSAADIENKASKSILNQVGENTSWKMMDGTVVESIKDASGKTNQTTTTAADTYQFVKDGDNTLAKRTSSTNDNLNITDGTNTYTKITTATGNKQTVTDGTETASTNLTKEASNTLIKNGTQSVLDHMAADTSYTVMNENGNGSRRQQTASEILDRVTDGTDTSEVKQTASEVAASAKNISNTATDKITSQIGDGSAVKSEMTAKGITNTAKDGTITNDAKDLVNTASNSITDKVGENVERTMGTKQIQDKVGKTTVTTTDGLTELTNKDRNHKTVMDYANVTKDLNVNGDATVDQKLTVKGDSDLQGNATVGKNLEVKGTSTLTGNVTMESDATVEKDLTVKGASEFVGRADFRNDVYVDNNLFVTGETRTDTLYVDHDGYVDGDLYVAGNIETHDAVLSADSRQVVTGRQLYQTNERVDRLDNRIKKVGANAAALAALRPGDFNPDDKFSIAAGFGSYRNANAAALGLFYRPNENVLLSLGTSFGDGENMVNAGVSVKFGRGKSMAERRKEMADEVSSMRDEMRSQDERIAELEEMLKKQSELIEKLSKES